MTFKGVELASLNTDVSKCTRSCKHCDRSMFTKFDWSNVCLEVLECNSGVPESACLRDYLIVQAWVVLEMQKACLDPVECKLRVPEMACM